MLPLDWKCETKIKMIGLANEFVKCAYLLGSKDPKLPKLFSEIIEST